MRRLLISTLALALLAAAPAAAASNDDHRHGGGNPQGHPPVHGVQGGGGGQIIHQGNGAYTGRHKEGGGNQVYRHERIDRGNNDHRGNFNRFNMTIHNQGIEPRRDRPRDWNVRPRHFDVHVYRRNFEASHRFHWRSYMRPRGWYAHRWTYGERLPRSFWVRDYWVSDWWMFDLARPPYGYEWVRYGDDALLVNIYTGEVLEVVYDLFD
jgi:Ni/Co efflux regulator RcnB